MSDLDEDLVPPPMADPKLAWSFNEGSQCWEGRNEQGEVENALCLPRFALAQEDFGSNQPAETRRKLSPEQLKKYLDRRRGVSA